MHERDALVAELASFAGWKALCDVMDEWEQQIAKELLVNTFDKLQDVARLQGQAAALRRLRTYVNNRASK